MAFLIGRIYHTQIKLGMLDEPESQGYLLRAILV